MRQVESQRARVTRNLALADTAELFQDFQKTVDEFAICETRVRQEIAALSAQAAVTNSAHDLAEEVLRFVDELPTLVNETHDFGKVAELFRTINLWLFVRFHAVQKTERIENHQHGGIITWGDVPSPIQKYSEPTGRHALQFSASIES